MMNNRKLVIVSLICVTLITIGFVVWFSELEAERKAQEYIENLEKMGCIIEEYPFSDSHVKGTLKMPFFGDFRSFATQEGINHIYCDREINALYFFHPIQDVSVEIVVFYYN